MPDTTGGTLMLVVISAATVVLTAAIAAFCAFGSWTLLPVMMAALFIATGAIVALLVHLMGDDVRDDDESPAPARA